MLSSDLSVSCPQVVSKYIDHRCFDPEISCKMKTFIDFPNEITLEIGQELTQDYLKNLYSNSIGRVIRRRKCLLRAFNFVFTLEREPHKYTRSRCTDIASYTFRRIRDSLNYTGDEQHPDSRTTS